MSAAAANDPIRIPAYGTVKPRARELLSRLLWCSQNKPLASYVLRRAEIATAMGLERRGLVSTYRPTQGLFHRRGVPGTQRTARLTKKGEIACVQYGLKPLELETATSGFDAVTSDRLYVLLQMPDGSTAELLPSEAMELADALTAAADLMRNKRR